MAVLPAVAIGASLLGGATSAIGAAQAGDAKAGMYNYQAGVADVNKKISLQNAAYARDTGESKAFESGLRTRFQEGKIKTAQGASGLDVNSGSAKATQDSQRDIGRLDQGIIRSNSARQAYGFDTEAVKYGAEGEMDRSAASNARTAGNIGAISSILGTAASVSSKWLQWGSVAGGGLGNGDAGGGKPTPGLDE